MNVKFFSVVSPKTAISRLLQSISLHMLRARFHLLSEFQDMILYILV